MRKLAVIFILMLGTAVMLAACSSASDTSQGSTAADVQTHPAEKAEEKPGDIDKEPVQEETKALLIEPEQLITQEEAEALLGEPLVGNKTENATVGQKILFYEAADGNSLQYLQISITQQAFMAAGSNSTPEQLYRDICAAFEASPVSNLGDEAQIIPSGYQILYNGYYLAVTAGYTNDDEGIMQEASQNAVNKLKALLGK